MKIYVPIWQVVLALLVVIAFSPATAHAGGWTQDYGKVYCKITYGSSSSNTVYTFDGGKKFPTDNGETTVRDYPLADRGLYFYTEYGLTTDLTFIANLALKRSIITSPIERRSTDGMGDITIAGKYKVAEFDQQVVSATLGVTFPTGYSRDLTPPLGNGDVGIEIAGNYGISFYPAPAYATGSLGYRIRPGIYGLSSLADETRTFEPNYSDEIFSELEAGYTFMDRFLVHGIAKFLFTTRTDDNDFDVQHPPETQQYIKVGGGVIADIYQGVAISADAMITPYGKKTSNSFDLFIGLAWSGNILSTSSTE